MADGALAYIHEWFELANTEILVRDRKGADQSIPGLIPEDVENQSGSVILEGSVRKRLQLIETSFDIFVSAVAEFVREQASNAAVGLGHRRLFEFQFN